MFTCVCVDEVVKLWVYGTLERVQIFILTEGLNILALSCSRSSLVYILCQSCVHINLTHLASCPHDLDIFELRLS